MVNIEVLMREWLATGTDVQKRHAAHRLAILNGERSAEPERSRVSVKPRGSLAETIANQKRR
jgi:hypothetical protein